MKRLMQWFKANPLLQSEQGSALPLVGLGIFVLLGSTGIAIDMGRAQIVQSRMQNALDAAGLAAGSEVSTTNLNSEVSKYFYANFPDHYLGTDVTSLTATPANDNKIFELNATGTVHTTFMKVFGINTVAVAAHSQVTRASKGMELVLVLDNTGSMANTAGGGVTKIQAVKDATAILLNILYGSNNTVPTLWVGVVPFSQAVNIGTGRGSWTNGSFTWGTTSWGGCVDAREPSGRDVTDDPPSVALFPKYYWPCDTNDQWYGTNSSHNNCSTGSGLQYKSGLGSSLGPNKSCPQPVLPMIAEKDAILASVNTMQAVGNTHIDLGMAWGWRMLSPRWRGLWGGEMDSNSLPLDYNQPLMNKVVILMTDGDNTIDNSSHGAYWYLSANHLGTTNSANAVTQLNTRTTNVCASMKAQGILIYTIALGTGFNATSLSMLQNCATKPAYAFTSPTTADLTTAFQQIGDSLANLRISQ